MNFCENDDCRFNIKVKYDFKKSAWIKDDMTKIDDIKWSPAYNMYPRKNNALSLSWSQKHNQPFYIPFTEDRVAGSSEDFGIFFCSDDEITLEFLKAGTIDQSRSLCEELWTPMLCENRTFDAGLVTLAIKLKTLLKSENQTLDWKQDYFSATSTVTGSFRKTTELLLSRLYENNSVA